MSETWKSTQPKESTYATTTASSIPTADSDGGFLLEREIIIYSISAGSIAVMVALGSCCFKYKRKAEHLYKSRPRTNHDQTSPERSDVQYRRNNESVYDLIDEDNMIGDETLIHSATRSGRVIQTRTTHSVVDQDGSSSSHSEGDVIDPFSEGYLNPYQPMIEVDLHGYRTLSDDTTHKSEKLSSGNSESSICSADKANVLVHPYQPIIPFVDIHNNSPIDEAVHKLTSHGQSMSDFNTGNNDHDAEQISESLKISISLIESEDAKNQTEKSLVVESKSKDDPKNISGIAYKNNHMANVDA
ncbi:uncharacterized protein LOC127726236 [Mytilus californianus]|uniref:uncharacterized protein LOC127726236 n=1 Tax=Mytilus californianus TaxID=6549 RepID=UPI0022472A34|nr:uncharacterized protein LOC127726236 [Mytilus californianus]